MSEIKNVYVWGARGYSGLELCRLLLKHPGNLKLHLISNSQNWKLSQDLIEVDETYLTYMTYSEFLSQKNLDGATTFFACSAQDAYKNTVAVLAKGSKVVDLSGAHRLGSVEAQKYYNLEYNHTYSLDESNYGLSPFAKAHGPLVSNPGCYVTSILMALIPLFKEGIIFKASPVVIDSKSGASGAGRSPKDLTNISELCEEIHPYKIGKHQHFPEILRYLDYFSQAKNLEVTFTTTLLPIKRGILSSIYCQTDRDIKISDIEKAYSKHYEGYPFVKVHALMGDDSDVSKLSLKNVLHTNYTQIAFHLDQEKLTLFSMIDNLVKGAAGQALENFNRMHDYPIDYGLKNIK